MRQTVKIICAAVVTAAFLAGGTALAGTLDPTATPAPTMKTLDQIPPTWSQKLPAAQRFELVLDGSGVLDKETGLVWEKSPSSVSSAPDTWYVAMANCIQMSLGGRRGWRLPTIEELGSLVDPTTSNPVLPSGHPFTNIHADGSYWSSSTDPQNYNGAYYINLVFGIAQPNLKNIQIYYWCVRGGQQGNTL